MELAMRTGGGATQLERRAMETMGMSFFKG
jgi:hypothetical protein